MNARIEGYLLALDTSTSNMTIALAKDGRLLSENDTEAVRNHSVQLLPNVQQLLREAGVSPKELAAVAVGHGPGSYTGVRIGVTAAKTLAWSLGIPLYGVSSLQALALSGLTAHEEATSKPAGGLIELTGGDGGDAWGVCTAEGCLLPGAPAAGAASGFEMLGGVQETEAAPSSPASGKRRWIVPLMDARRGQAFTALYEAGYEKTDAAEGLVTALQSDGIRLVKDWLEELSSMLQDETTASGSMPDEILFVGETALFAEQLERFAVQWPEKSAIKTVGLRARDVALLAAHGGQPLRGGQIHDFAPNYTQLAEAEVKLLKAAKERK